jgi:endonuclease/exonuclease/phosphatase family metal-dependent hydrolase
LFTTTIKTGDLRIVSWTMSHSKKSSSFESAQELIRLDGDVTLLTHGWYVRGEPIIKEWLGSGGRKVTNGPFTLLTKQRVLNVQTLIASEGIFISMFEIDTTPTLGKTIVLWAIDLPSSFRDSKMEIAKRAKRLLDTQHAAPPDIVIGDFNMTRNSASIKTIFPNLHDASDQGGVGWLASYPMSVPLYHIDHVLVADSLRALSYRLLNPRIGRHRLQITELEIVD